MTESKRTKGPFQGFSTLDSPSILSKLINNHAMERPIRVTNESLNNFDEDDSGIFHYLLDDTLKDAWDRILRIRASYVPQYQIELYLKSFYVGLPASFKQVLDSIFEGGFLEGDAIDTYESMKTIFGHPMNDKVESTTLLCFYQNEIIKEMKASLDANFHNVLNLSSSINGNVLSQNRRMNDIERKFALYFPSAKYGTT